MSKIKELFSRNRWLVYALICWFLINAFFFLRDIHYDFPRRWKLYPVGDAYTYLDFFIYIVVVPAVCFIVWDVIDRKR